MKYLILALITFVSPSCDINDDNMKIENDVVPGPDVILSFSLQDEGGIDLLNPNSDTSFKHEEISFYEDLSLTKEISAEWSPEPSGDVVINKWEIDQTMVYKISILAHGETEINDSTVYGSCYLKLSDGIVDKIAIEITKKSTSSYVSKFSYAGKVIFDDLESKSNWNGIIIK